MADWDGQGLPPAAAARMARFQADGVRTSLLSVPGGVGAESVGLRPVGEVMGCIVEHIGWQGFGGCGMYGSSGFGFGLGGMSGPTVSSGQGQRWAGFAPYVDALYRGYLTALDRMRTEAHTMGADGIVGVTLAVTHMGEGNREFMAMGTAVRASSTSRPARLFCTDLEGQDVAKLLHSGWVPVDLAIGIAVAIRHDDWRTQTQTMGLGFAGNVEVAGYTELVTHVRADARHQFGRHAAASGGEAAVVSSMSLHVHEIEPSENHRDHVAEAHVFGATIARFHRGPTAPSSALTMIPLRPM